MEQAQLHKDRRTMDMKTIYVVEYPSFDRETRNFCWKELVRYSTRKLAEKVVRMNRKKAELRFRKLDSP